MKKIVYAVGVLVLVGAGVGLYLYNKPHQNIKNSQPDLEISAADLFAAFEENEAFANEQYLDKLILLEGEVMEFSQDEEGNTSLTLKSESLFGVICHLDHLTKHERTEFDVGEVVKLKGLCTGMLMDVVLVRCVEVNQ